MFGMYKKITQDQLIKFLLDHNDEYRKSNLRIQKTVYIIFGVLTKEDINRVDIDSFEFERWMYGPVNRKLYYNFKTDMLNLYDNEKKINSKYVEKISKIADYLLYFSVENLIEFTHELDSWKEKKNFELMDNDTIISDFKIASVDYNEQ